MRTFILLLVLLLSAPLAFADDFYPTNQELFFQVNDVELARRGCCSWHGGVCGCIGGRARCCDGTLSPSCGCLKPSTEGDINYIKNFGIICREDASTAVGSSTGDTFDVDSDDGSTVEVTDPQTGASFSLDVEGRSGDEVEVDDSEIESAREESEGDC